MQVREPKNQNLSTLLKQSAKWGKKMYLLKEQVQSPVGEKL